jgi:acetyl esterase/lipase
MTRRGLSAALLSALAAACTPLAAFNRLAPRDPARRGPSGVAYGEDPRQRLDLYAPLSAGGPVPVLVFFYGGAWNSGRRQDYGWVGQALAAQGYLVAVADHRLVPGVRFPAFVEDGARAVARTLELAPAHGGDPGRLILAGHSSGAYIAAMLALAPAYLGAAGVEPGRVRAFAGLSGPYDFYPFDVAASIEAFQGAADPRATQPVDLDLAGAPPTFLGHGSRDIVVAPRNSQALARALAAAGDEVQLKIYPGLDHKDMALALSRPFRGKAPVLADMIAFLRARA